MEKLSIFVDKTLLAFNKAQQANDVSLRNEIDSSLIHHSFTFIRGVQEVTVTLECFSTVYLILLHLPHPKELSLCL